MGATRLKSVSLASIIGFAMAVATVACDDPLGPDDVAGTYAATTLTFTTDAGETSDALAQGVKLTLTLTKERRTSGEFFIPAALSESGTDETYNLIGIYQIDEIEDDAIVTFGMQADTFIRDTEFVATGDQLRAQLEDITVVLTK